LEPNSKCRKCPPRPTTRWFGKIGPVKRFPSRHISSQRHNKLKLCGKGPVKRLQLKRKFTSFPRNDGGGKEEAKEGEEELRPARDRSCWLGNAGSTTCSSLSFDSSKSSGRAYEKSIGSSSSSSSAPRALCCCCCKKMFAFCTKRCANSSAMFTESASWPLLLLPPAPPVPPRLWPPSPFFWSPPEKGKWRAAWALRARATRVGGGGVSISLIACLDTMAGCQGAPPVVLGMGVNK